jgi:hypothetical protein
MRRYVFIIGSAGIACIAAAGLLVADPPRIITNSSAPAVSRDNPAIGVRVDSTGAAATLVIPAAGAGVAPAAVVSRELSLQPTYDRLATLQIADMNTIFDPYADLRRADMPSGGLDEHHMLLQAQRLWQSRSGQCTPRVIVGGPDAGGGAVEAQSDPSFVRLPAPLLPAAAPAAPAQPQPLAAKK